MDEARIGTLLDDAAAAGPFRRLLAGSGPVRSAKAAGAGHPFAAAVLARALDAPVLAVTPDPRSADAFAAGAAAFIGDARVAVFPAWESLPYEGISPVPQVAGRRARTAHLLRRAEGPCVFVAPVAAAVQALAPTLGEHEPTTLTTGSTFGPDELIARLTDLGYERADVVEHRGEFAVRGGLVDVFPATARRPVRVDYWGDQIESLRLFSPSTQLTTAKADAVAVHPARELPLDDAVRRRAADAAGRYRGRYASLLDRLAEGLVFEGMEQAIPLVFDRLSHLTDLLPDGAWVVVASALRTQDRAARILEEADALARAADWPGPRAIDGIETALGTRQRVELTEFGDAPDLGITSLDALASVQPVGVQAGGARGGSNRMAATVASLAADGATVAVGAEGRGSLDRSAEVLEAEGLAADDLIRVQADVDEGFVFDPGDGEPGRLVLVTEQDLFGRRRHTRETPRLTQRRADAVAAELEPGDLAVHQVHGVGRYVGVVRREIAGSERDYLLLEYAHGDRLYVPSDQVGRRRELRGRRGAAACIAWARATGTKQKAKVRRAIRDMAGELVRLYSVRLSAPGLRVRPRHAVAARDGGRVPVRGDPRPARRHRRDQARHGVGEADGPPDLRRRRLRQDRGRAARRVQGGVRRQAGRGARADDAAREPALARRSASGSRNYPGRGRGALAVPARRRSRTTSSRACATARSTSSSARTGCCRRTSRSRTSGLLVVDEEQRFGVQHKERIKQLRARASTC